MSEVKLVSASSVIASLGKTLGYSRPHIANLMRVNASALGAKKADRRWKIPRQSVPKLKKLVKQSGRRYKLGERGPHGRS